MVATGQGVGRGPKDRRDTAAEGVASARQPNEATQAEKSRGRDVRGETLTHAADTACGCEGGTGGQSVAGREVAAGFEDIAAYLLLDFLDPAEVALGAKFEAILPILCMSAGCRGAPEMSRGAGKWFIPKQTPFAVLLKEAEFG